MAHSRPAAASAVPPYVSQHIPPCPPTVLPQLRYTWSIYANRLVTLSHVYTFWKRVTSLESRETKRYLGAWVGGWVGTHGLGWWWAWAGGRGQGRGQGGGSIVERIESKRQLAVSSPI